MNYKLLILDLDGTTVEPSEKALPSQKVIDAVKKAQEKVHVAVATGRSLSLAQNVIDALGLKGLGVVSGGAEIVKMDTGEVVLAKTIDVDTIKELVKVSLPFGYKLFFSGTGQYDIPISSPDEITTETEMFFIEAVKTSDSAHLLEEFESMPGVTAHPTKSWIPGDVVDIHVTHEHATKRYGAERLIKMLGLNKGQVVAIGDDYNDVPLMMTAGTKVAMGESPEEVQSVADFVTTSLKDDGVAHAIDKLILNTEKH